MIQVKICGRGGQGAKTAVEILAKAANYEDKFFLAYPEFGPERAGTPINAYFKLSDKEIRDRSPIENPEIVLVFDKTLEEYCNGLRENGKIIINSSEEKEHHFIDVNSILGKINIAPNITMLGALIKITNILKKESVEKAIKDSFSDDIAELNLKFFRRGYEEVK